MAGVRSDFQYPIRKEINANLRQRWNTTYVYAFNGCGKEVRGYAQSRVKGHIWCNDCNRQRQKKYVANSKKNSVLREIKDKVTVQEIDNVKYYRVDDVQNLFKTESEDLK